MKKIFDDISIKASRITTKKYSTSFSMGIWFFSKELRDPIYAIYGFVRFGDEIVDTFHEYDKHKLFEKFRQDTHDAIHDKISLNPILNSFQHCVNQFSIPMQLIDSFLNSMEMDLSNKDYSTEGYRSYIYGSAEVVGLMCLKVFCNGEDALYESLKENAIKLGAAYQKVNFLRDLNADFYYLGRSYFPDVNIENFSLQDKLMIEKEIESDFQSGLEGIKRLPNSSKLGVYLSYVYFYSLFSKIKKSRPESLFKSRIRISNAAKFLYTFRSLLRLKTLGLE